MTYCVKICRNQNSSSSKWGVENASKNKLEIVFGENKIFKTLSVILIIINGEETPRGTFFRWIKYLLLRWPILNFVLMTSVHVERTLTVFKNLLLYIRLPLFQCRKYSTCTLVKCNKFNLNKYFTTTHFFFFFNLLILCRKY